MSSGFKIFGIALVTSVATQVVLTPFLMSFYASDRAPEIIERIVERPPAPEPSPPPEPETEKLAAPNLEGMTVKDAQDRWRDKGLVVIEEGERVSEQAEGTIIKQRPSPGAKLETREVRVIVARASEVATIPDVIGKTAQKGQDELREAGFAVGEPKLEPSDKKQGTIIKQLPEAGTEGRRGSLVRLVVAEPAAIKVPKVRGQYIGQAKEALEDLGLELGSVRKVEDYERPDGMVVRQEPAPDEEVPPGTKIDVVIVGT